MHGAAGWLLRHWGQRDSVRAVDQTPVPYSPDRQWFTLAITVTPTAPPKPSEDQPAEPLLTKTFYYTFIVFPASEYSIGSVSDEQDRQRDEARQSIKLSRPFALLDRQITFEELVAFSPQYLDFMQRFDAKSADAGSSANWYDSVGFCRWLGRQSDVSEADQPYAAPESLDEEAYPREPVLEANWAPRNWPVNLAHRGFRLPTEAEWEVACRAGARTTYGYGSDVSLLGRFAWFMENGGKRVHPPRELRPSVRGLFDMHGNVYEWTHDWYGDFGNWFGDFGNEAVTDPLGANDGSGRVYRGASWSDPAWSARSANRGRLNPSVRSSNLGFRLALSPLGPVSGAPGE